MQTLFVLVVMIVFAIGAASRADAQQPAAAARKGADNAETECLAKPKGLPPEGKRWAYRTNRTIKRRCWFLTDQRKESSRHAEPKPAERRVSSPRAVTPSPRRVVALDRETEEVGAEQAERSAGLTPPPPGKRDGDASPTPPRLNAHKSADVPVWFAQPLPAQRQPTPETDPFLAEPIESIQTELPIATDDRAVQASVADAGAMAEPSPAEPSASAVKNAPKPQPSSTLLLALLFGSFAVAAASIHGIVRIVR